MIETETQRIPPPSRVVALEDQPFWDAIDAGNFVLAHCTCGAYYARMQACLHCKASPASLSWVAASGQGTVRTFVIFDKPYHPYFEGRVPYVVAVVTLREGPEILTNVIDADVSAVEIGMAVRIVIGDRGGQKIHQASARI
ncbi:MAG: OB-fold domain-containing protein [Gammaproteobacteria bacterium]|nr:OB-fold domain-containing protein [Gammaproteobacteria bacterium]